MNCSLYKIYWHTKITGLNENIRDNPNNFNSRMILLTKLVNKIWVNFEKTVSA